MTHRTQLNEDVGNTTRQFTIDELVTRLNDVGVPCGPIYDVGQAFGDRQVKHLKMTKSAMHDELGPINLVRSPINLSRFPHGDSFHHAGPAPGQHSDEILREFGFSDGEISQLKQSGAIE